MPPNPITSKPKPRGPDRSLWWRHIFEESEDAQCVCDSEGNVVEINRKARQLLGVDANPAETTRRLRECLTDTTHTKLMHLLHGRKGRSEVLTAVTLRFEDGFHAVGDLHVRFLHDVYWLVTIKDASRRWRLETHAQRLITAINSTQDAVFLTDAEFRFTFVNSAFHSFTGYTFEDVLGQTIALLCEAPKAAWVREKLQTIRQGENWVAEIEIRCRNGPACPVELTISPIFDQQGGFIGSVAFLRDQTAKKRLQDELRSERNLVKSIINSLDAAVYTLDRNFNLTHFNEGWQKIPRQHGWLNLEDHSPEAGKCLLDYVEDSERRDQLRALFEKVLREGEPQEIRATTPSRQWLINIGLWKHGDEIRGLIYKVSDHTQFIELQSQLFQAQKMETIGALASGVAHDFNNLLLAIQGNIGLVLLDKSLPAGITQRLGQIENAAKRGTEITKQLLSFSRASDEQLDVLDFNQVIREASQLAKRSLRSSKVVVKLQPSDDPVKVQMDATRAQQLILNLCVNAIDAMPNGGRLLLSNTLVHLTRHQAAKINFEPQSKFVCCSVRDTGVGIPTEVRARIFDPFFTTKEKGKGTGIGLAVVQNIINKVGGFLEVESEVGKGTAFHLYFPAVQSELTTIPAAPPDHDLNAGSGRLLVVDDLDLVLDFTGNFLKAAGYEVFTASGAEEALDILEREETDFDLLLTDYNMPGKNGWQLIEEVSQRWPRMKLVLASGFLEDSDRLQMESQFGARVLSKPYNISEATDLIAETLRH